jgi:hypothetical protein
MEERKQRDKVLGEYLSKLNEMVSEMTVELWRPFIEMTTLKIEGMNHRFAVL